MPGSNPSDHRPAYCPDPQQGCRGSVRDEAGLTAWLARFEDVDV
jgi:hypothetical protein